MSRKPDLLAVAAEDRKESSEAVAGYGRRLGTESESNRTLHFPVRDVMAERRPAETGKR